MQVAISRMRARMCFDAVGIILSRLCFDSGFGRVIAARDEGRVNYFCRIHRERNMG